MGLDITGIGSVADLLKEVVGMVDPNKRAEAETKIIELGNQVALAQIGTNTAEATTGNIFLAGWRPFVGWVCGLGFAYQIFLVPLHAPPIDSATLNNVLWALLGFGTMRTADKVAGVATDAIKKIFR